MDQCCVFINQNPERMIELAEFDFVEDYDGHKYGHDLYDNDFGGRVLLKCHKCGRYVLRQKSSFIEASDDGDTDFITYWPVESPEEADRLNREYAGDLLRHLKGKRSFIQMTRNTDGVEKYHASIIPSPETTKISEIRFELFDPREEAEVENWVRFYNDDTILDAVKIYIDGTELNDLLKKSTCYINGDVDNYHDFGHRSFNDLYHSLTSAESVGDYHSEYVLGMMCCPFCGNSFTYHPATYVRAYGDCVYWDNLIYDKGGKQMNFRFDKEQYHAALEKLKQDYCKLMDVAEYSEDDPFKRGEHYGWKNINNNGNATNMFPTYKEYCDDVTRALEEHHAANAKAAEYVLSELHIEIYLKNDYEELKKLFMNGKLDEGKYRYSVGAAAFGLINAWNIL